LRFAASAAGAQHSATTTAIPINRRTRQP
jgi:hypothetical protein